MADTPRVWPDTHATIAHITLPTGSIYDIKDEAARNAIESIEGTLAGGVSLIGTTTTALTDGAATPTTIVINGSNHTVIKGNLVIYSKKEFLWDGSQWIELGDLGAFKALAYKDTASATYTPAGTITQPTFTGSSAAVTITATANSSGNYQPAGTVTKPSFTGSSTTFSGSFTPAGTVTVTTLSTSNKSATVTSATGTATYTPSGTVTAPAFTGSNTTFSGAFTPAGSISFSTTNKTATVASTTGTATYTPGGSVAAPVISLKTAGTTTTGSFITGVGTLPALTTTVANENLTLGWSAGTLPTQGNSVTVKTGDAAYEATAPAFTGTGVRLVTGNIAVPTTATFSGTEDTVSVSGTPNGSVAAPTFNGTGVRLVTGNIAVPNTYSATFSGTADNISVSGTPDGEVS